MYAYGGTYHTCFYIHNFNVCIYAYDKLIRSEEQNNLAQIPSVIALMSVLSHYAALWETLLNLRPGCEVIYLHSLCIDVYERSHKSITGASSQLSYNLQK